MSQSLKYVGLDVHKATIAVAVAEDDKRSEVREHGEIANTPAAPIFTRPRSRARLNRTPRSCRALSSACPTMI